MTTRPRESGSTADPIGSAVGDDDLTAGPDRALPSGLPNEATLNRLAGEFFAGLPGFPAGTGMPGTGLPTGPSGGRPSTVGAPRTEPGAVEHAPRVDVPARSNEISRVPGDSGSNAVTPTPPVAAPDLPGLAVGDPEPVTGYAPGRAVPDVSEAVTAVLGAAGLGLTVPEGPIVPGLTGLQLAEPGALTPVLPGLSEPRPDEAVPGLPAEDPLAAGAGPLGSPPDVSAAVPLRGGFGPPAAAPESPFQVGALVIPTPGGEQLPPLEGLSAPLPSAGLPGLPASDQVVAGAGLPGGPSDVTTAAAGLTGAELGPMPQGLSAVPESPAVPDPSRATPGMGVPSVPGLPAPPDLPVDASSVASPAGAPFTPAAGLQTPDLPMVPALSTDSSGAIPGAAQSLPASAVPFDAGAAPALPDDLDAASA